MLEFRYSGPRWPRMNVLRSITEFCFGCFLVVLIFIASACRSAGGINEGPTSTPPPDIQAAIQVFRDLSPTVPSKHEDAIVEVWNSLSRDYIEKDDLDPNFLSKAAIEAMVEAQGSAQGDLNPDVMVQAAVEAMLETLEDPYTSYLDPDEYKRYEENSEGKFEGIGAYVDLIDGRITITAPIPNTPAAKAGIQPGDVILEVNGISTKGWSLIESIIQIRGPKGTKVRLLVQHPDTNGTTLVEITRDVIETTSMHWKILRTGIAYIEISMFAENTDEALTDALQTINKENPAGIILDLRNNLGGLLSTTVNIASHFLEDGLVLYSINGDGDRTDYEVKSGGLAHNTPLVVLINQFSASASEVLSGTLQDHDRAILIGTSTFGKGSVNLPVSLSNGGGLYFTIGRWYSPNGHLIEGDGLEPDITVEASLRPSEDRQLEAAIEYLSDQINVASP